MSATAPVEQVPRSSLRAGRSADSPVGAGRKKRRNRWRPSCGNNSIGMFQQVHPCSQLIEIVKLLAGEETGRIDNRTDTIFHVSETPVPDPLLAGKSERQRIDGRDFANAFDRIDKQSDSIMAEDKRERRPRDRQMKVIAAVHHVIRPVCPFDNMADLRNLRTFEFDGGAGEAVRASNFLNGISRDRKALS